MMGKNNKALKIAVTVAAFVFFVFALTFGFLNSVPAGSQTNVNVTYNAAPSVFIHTTVELRYKYPNTIGPASWAFIFIWPVIFLWNAVGTLYMVASLCLSKDRSPVMREPAMMPVSSLIFWCLAWGFTTAWIFLYDREIMWAATVFLALGAWCGYTCLALSYKSYFQDILLLEEYSSRMLWLVRILIHNGFAVLITWITCAWKLNLATAITYADNSRWSDNPVADLRGSLTSEDGGTIALSILLLELVVWFVLENTIFERYCRYTLTIYPVLIYALTAIFTGNAKMPEGYIVFSRNQVIVLTGIIMASLAFVIRIVLVIVKHRRRPRFA